MGQHIIGLFITADQEALFLVLLMDALITLSITLLLCRSTSWSRRILFFGAFFGFFLLLSHWVLAHGFHKPFARVQCISVQTD